MDKQYIGFLAALEMWVRREFSPKYAERVITDLVDVYTGNKTSTMPVYEHYRRCILRYQVEINK